MLKLDKHMLGVHSKKLEKKVGVKASLAYDGLVIHMRAIKR